MTPPRIHRNPSSEPPVSFTCSLACFHHDEDLRSWHRRCISDLACRFFQRPRWSASVVPSGDCTSQLLLDSISQLSSCIQLIKTMGTKHQAPKGGRADKEGCRRVAEHVRCDRSVSTPANGWRYLRHRGRSPLSVRRFWVGVTIRSLHQQRLFVLEVFLVAWRYSYRRRLFPPRAVGQ